MQFSGAMSFLKEKILALRRHFTWHKLGIEPLCRLELFPWKSSVQNLDIYRQLYKNPTEKLYLQIYSQKYSSKCINKREDKHSRNVQSNEQVNVQTNVQKNVQTNAKFADK